MADKKVAPIILKFEDKEYTLEFDREAIAYAESIRFNPDDFNLKAQTSATLFFHLAFRMHHPELTKEETDNILYDDLGGLSQEMIDRLIELYNKPYKELMNKSGKPKNARLTVIM